MDCIHLGRHVFVAIAVLSAENADGQIQQRKRERQVAELYFRAGEHQAIRVVIFHFGESVKPRKDFREVNAQINLGRFKAIAAAGVGRGCQNTFNRQVFPDMEKWPSRTTGSSNDTVSPQISCGGICS